MSEERQIPGAALPTAARRNRALTLKTLGAACLSGGRRRSGETVVFGPGKPLALLAYLDCAPNHTASRDCLVDLLWSDGAREAGQHNLRQAVWHIRQRLGDNVLAAHRGTMTLVAEFTCDRNAFLAAVEGADLERAVGLYGGDFLPGGAGAGARGFEEWADLERYRLRRIFSRAAESLVRQWLPTGRYADAQRLARRVRDADPREEGAWALLVETLLAGGELARAAAEADLLERVLTADRRVPGPSTRALLQRARRAAERGGWGGAPETLAPALAGRERELNALARAWAAAQSGAGRHVHVVGGAGLGKTRLLRELQARVGAAGGEVVYVAARVAARRVPFGFASDLATALAELPGSVGISTDAAGALLALNASLSRRFAGSADPTGAEEPVRRRALALLELLGVLSEQAPLALLCDDFEWADPASTDAFAWVLANLGAMPVLCVTAGPLGLAPTCGSPSEQIELAPLSPASLRTLIASLAHLPQAEWAERLPASLHATTGGWPRLVLERLERVVALGLLAREAGGWACPDPSRLAAEVAAPAVAESVRLLVAPFAADGPAGSEHLVDGVTNGLIADLSQIKGLQLISDASASLLKGITTDRVKIGRELNVRYVVEGTVGRAGDRVRIHAKLIDTGVGARIWAARYEGAFEDVLDVREQMMQEIVKVLNLHVSPEEQRRIGSRPIENVHAYECYLRARHDMWLLTREALDRAVRHLESGLDLVGDNELLLATLGEAYVHYANAGLAPPDLYVEKARACVSKIFGLNAASSRGHGLNGVISTLTDPPRIQEAVRDLRRAIALDSNNPEALFWLVANYGISGKCFAARPFLIQLLAIDPLRPPHHVLHGHLETMDGRFDEALEPFRKASKMDPLSPSIQWHYAMALLWSGSRDEADAVIDRLAHDAPGTIFAASTSFVKYALAQNGDKARSMVTAELRAVARRHPMLPLSLVEGYALLGDNDDALAWLETAVRCGFINYPFLSQADPLLACLRGDPRFAARMEHVKRQWEAFEV